jgi:hypothetical protein
MVVLLKRNNRPLFLKRAFCNNVNTPGAFSVSADHAPPVGKNYKLSKIKKRKYQCLWRINIFGWLVQFAGNKFFFETPPVSHDSASAGETNHNWA